MPLGEIDAFDVDQTGLTLDEMPGANGMSTVTVNYSTSTQILFGGERNFLALAFDLQVPIGQDASVTYSPNEDPDATISMGDLICNVDCGSSNPSAAMTLNPGTISVPGPLAVTAVPMMWHTSRRLRRRLQGSERPSNLA
ncbi:MAG: hypothetical protein VKN56_00245 [Cyanobacteriota bacterium]|nr:hypothetical protein [Cyanobacteriota bacterium]